MLVVVFVNLVKTLRYFWIESENVKPHQLKPTTNIHL